MIRSILIPTDGSPTSKAALNIAASIAALSQAKLFGLYIEDSRRFYQFEYVRSEGNEQNGSILSMSPLPGEDALEQRVTADLEAEEICDIFANECRSANIDGSFSVREGKVTSCILDVAKTVDLVVMGSRGNHKGVSDYQPRETSLALLHDSSTPILVVPEGAEGTSEMVVAYDGSSASQRALRLAAEISEITEMSISIFTAADSIVQAKEIQKAAFSYLEPYTCKAFSVCRVGKADETLITYVKESGASIVALGSFSSDESKKNFFGNTTSSFLQSEIAATLLVA